MVKTCHLFWSEHVQLLYVRRRNTINPVDILVCETDGITSDITVPIEKSSEFESTKEENDIKMQYEVGIAPEYVLTCKVLKMSKMNRTPIRPNSINLLPCLCRERLREALFLSKHLSMVKSARQNMTLKIRVILDGRHHQKEHKNRAVDDTPNELHFQAIPLVVIFRESRNLVHAAIEDS